MKSTGENSRDERIIFLNRRGSQGWGKQTDAPEVRQAVRFSAPAARKGIALTTQAVILLVLAAVILGSILLFFTNTFNPQEKGFGNIANQTVACQNYVRHYINCDNAGDATDNFKSLLGICGEQGYPDCIPEPSGAGKIKCFKQCCANFCG